MLDKLEERNKKLEKTIQLANTSDEDLEKMSFREKQKVFNKAIEYIETHKRKDEFLELNEWETRELLDILKEVE